MTTMDITNLGSEEALLEEIGHRLTRWRIDRGYTQAELAKQAGIGKRTLERMESGGSSQMVSFLRVLRVLGLLEGLEQLLPPSEISPMDLLRLKGKQRQRASSKTQAVREPAQAWTWADE